MKRFFIDILPTKQQYKSWSKPSKLTFIGFVLTGISLLITLIVLVLGWSIRNLIVDVDIKGKWVDEKAKMIVIEMLKDYGCYEEFGFNKLPTNNERKLIHEIIGVYSVSYINYNTNVVITYTKPSDFDCHVCAPKLSIFEFKSIEKGWKLERKFINSIEQGTWGDPPSSLKVMQIGYNKFGVVIEHGSLGQGIFTGYTSIYSFIGDEIKEIFNAQTYLNTNYFGDSVFDFPLSDWEAKIQVKKEGTSFFDLIVIKEGIVDNLEFKTIDLYKFDGVIYSKSLVYE